MSEVKRKIASILAVVIASTVAASSPASAGGSPVVGSSSGGSDDGAYPEIVVVAPGTGTTVSRDGTTFYPTGQIGPDTLIVMPDFYESLGLRYSTIAEVDSRSELVEMIDSRGQGAASATCGGQVVAYYGSWSPVSTSPCGTIGRSGYYLHYSWHVQANTN
jgi:hypothetical protein